MLSAQAVFAAGGSTDWDQSLKRMHLSVATGFPIGRARSEDLPSLYAHYSLKTVVEFALLVFVDDPEQTLIKLNRVIEKDDDRQATRFAGLGRSVPRMASVNRAPMQAFGALHDVDGMQVQSLDTDGGSPVVFELSGLRNNHSSKILLTREVEVPRPECRIS
ncbi:hypothetical protein GX51_02018 [Blastomyces parvus]|uniref:Uncharacterized protein n=1 Tax=Blastomyces parvus TaxID=2060905 RepID=A0A2B7XDI6_9EURO|nr:hypothetical protein GX51_02018 [Blastomyces parvus]